MLIRIIHLNQYSDTPVLGRGYVATKSNAIASDKEIPFESILIEFLTFGYTSKEADSTTRGHQLL